MATKKTSTAHAARPLQTGSLTDALARLEVGETLSRVREMDLTRKLVPADFVEAKRSMVSTITPTTARVLERFPERRFEIESGTVMSSGHSLYCVCLVKRIK